MSLHHATLHQLKIFNTLARHMSVAQTARAMHLTPPAVSIQVKQLAEAVGEPLLEQVGKQLYLTETGKVVAAACRDIFDRLELLSQDLAAMEGLHKGSLHLAALTTAQYFIPRLLGEFSREYPGLDVSLFVGNREAILDRLSRNEDDLYILGQPPDSTRIFAEPFAENPLVAIAYPDHPLVGRKRIRPKQLGGESFIAREQGSGTRLACESFFLEHEVPLSVRLELGSNEAVKQTVAAGLGISIISKSAVQAELASGEIAMLDVVGLPLQRQWYVVRPEKKIQTAAARAFQDFLVTSGLG
ncbi:LysR family transcriptional regulator [Thiohalobacter sp.]|uniref:LysR family transcriptional regulator n=1 Tax=Thiohalobacter sp. TaxID=2025948 RepID=UPI0026175899|nr:LysR family transcriptional regulator [Thiohalobacter sp.]